MKKKNRRKKKLRTKSGLTIRGKIVIYLTLFTIALITVIVLLLTLPQFSLVKVNINELVKIEEKEILEKANFELGKNIFLQRYFKAEKEILSIKAVKDVDITLKLPDHVNIEIEERKETYQINLDNQYIIIDEQGFLIKRIEEKINIPEIIGVKASFENDIRLDAEELTKLENINKIYNTTKILNIDGLISGIELKNKGFSINFASSKKVAHFENTNNLMNSMQFVREILCLDENKKKSGDIYATEEGARFSPK